MSQRLQSKFVQGKNTTKKGNTRQTTINDCDVHETTTKPTRLLYGSTSYDYVMQVSRSSANTSPTYPHDARTRLRMSRYKMTNLFFSRVYLLCSGVVGATSRKHRQIPLPHGCRDVSFLAKTTMRATLVPVLLSLPRAGGGGALPTNTKYT